MRGGPFYADLYVAPVVHFPKAMAIIQLPEPEPAPRVFLRHPRLAQVPNRTHRRRRVRKKWLKRYGVRLVPQYDFDPETVLRVGNDFYAYEPAYSRLIAELKRADEAAEKYVAEALERAKDRMLQGATDPGL